jgi:NAD+ kinase
MKPIALIFKKSIYQIYFEEREPSAATLARFTEADIERLRNAHAAHLQTLQQVEAELQARDLKYRKFYRARQVNYEPYDLIISVGGDGTFLEAQRRITTQTIVGVNSDPNRSVGNFCRFTADSFGQCLTATLSGSAKLTRLNRMRLTLDGAETGFQVLNDVLIAHQQPAAMSVYEIDVNGDSETQYGSGLWISTAAGSTGGIMSAGGSRMAMGSKKLQYRPRELFHGRGNAYALPGAAVTLQQPITVRSRMREGILYVDGAHLRIPFPYGAVLKICNSEHALKVVGSIE